MRKKDFMYLLTVMMVAMLSVCFVSCGDDDNGDNVKEGDIVSMLQGTWEFYSGKETINGVTVTMKRSDLDQMKAMLSNSMGMRVYFWDETLTFSGYRVNDISYKMKGKQIIMDGMDLMEGFTISVKSITSTALVLHEVISMDGIDLVADMEYHKDADNNTVINNGNGYDNTTEIPTDYTATYSVKTGKFGNAESVVFYQDYNNKYEIRILNGDICLTHSVRFQGNLYNHDYYNSTIVSAHSKDCGIKDYGKISKISDITSKNVYGGEGQKSTEYLNFCSNFQPNHGYITMFTTEEGEKKYMRIYAESYTLYSYGSLESVTIQYQLY